MSAHNQQGQSRVSFPKSERKAQSGATITGKTDPQRIIGVSVIVKRKNPLNLDELGGRHLSQEEFAENYAADPSSFDHLREFAHKNGLTVDEGASSLARRTIVMRGPVAKVEQAFGVKLNDYEKEGRKYHSYVGAISITQEHAEPVEAVLGLDDHPVAKPHFRLFDHKRRKRHPSPTHRTPPAQTASFNAPQVAQLYGFPTSVNGAGQTIGILEFGGGYNAGDLSTYFTGLGIPEPQITAVSVDGATNNPNQPSTPDNPNADGEVALDIEIAGSIAPGANIAVYFAPISSQGFVDALTTAIHDTNNGPPSVISISWGGPEVGWTQQAMTAFDEACQSAVALGITITVASGDDGSSDGASGNNVDFPASSPNVLACGGTELFASGSAISQEVVWDDLAEGGGATGGGFSTYFPVPSYQSSATGVAAGALAGATGRGVPDVAGDASPETGYNIIFDGQSQPVGGTSAVAPLWAALIALLNQQRGSNLGFINPAIYQNAETGFNDITQGNNGAFSAGPGWDACTGLGSPNVGQLAPILPPSTGTASAKSGTGQAHSHARQHAHTGD
jgi:kumamolisin